MHPAHGKRDLTMWCSGIDQSGITALRCDGHTMLAAKFDQSGDLIGRVWQRQKRRVALIRPAPGRRDVFQAFSIHAPAFIA